MLVSYLLVYECVHVEVDPLQVKNQILRSLTNAGFL